jgi:hypothetical protein
VSLLNQHLILGFTFFKTGIVQPVVGIGAITQQLMVPLYPGNKQTITYMLITQTQVVTPLSQQMFSSQINYIHS